MALRVPIKIAESYAAPGQESKLFPQHTNYLTRDEVHEAFPGGLMFQERFNHQGLSWRLVKRPSSHPVVGATYLAVLDEPINITPQQQQSSTLANGTGRQGSVTLLQDDTRSPASRPLVDLSDDTHSDVSGPVILHSQNGHHSSPRVSQPSSVIVPVSPSASRDVPHRDLRSKFIEDLLVASDSPIPMDRCGAGISACRDITCRV